MAGMTKYERQLRAQLRDSDLWPSFDSPDFLQRLDDVAGTALQKRSIEGNLAAILIYQQLVEEMCKLLIRDSQFLVRTVLSPWRVGFPERQKQMFGQVLQDLRDAVDFPKKQRFLKLADAINQIRIGIVHKLPRRGSFRGLRSDALRAKQLFDRAFDIFDAAHDGFRVDLHGLQKDICY